MNIQPFLKKYNTTFNKNSFKLVFDLGGNESDDLKRAQQANQRVKRVFDSLFKKKDLWLILISWDTKTKMLEELKTCGFEINDSNTLIEGKKEDLIVNYDLLNPIGTYYLHYKEINYSSIENISLGIINNELGLEPYTGIRAYFVSFEGLPIFLNLYDDRGLELLVTNEKYYDQISSEFKNILCS
jgi:hypothetical protein